MKILYKSCYNFVLTYNYQVLFFMLLLFISSAGNAQITRQWVSTYNAQGDFNDHYTCITKDQSGNIYIGGSTVNPDQDKDYLIVKLNSSGQLVWNKIFSGSGKGADEITAIAVDTLNNVYVTGYFKQLVSGTDFYTIKMDMNGDTLWTMSYNNVSAFGYDQANSIFIDGSGNVYVTGQSDSNPTSISNDDYLTIKYSSAGSELWTARFNGTGNAIDKAVKVVV